MTTRDRRDILYGTDGSRHTEPFTMDIDSQGELTIGGQGDTNVLQRDSAEFQKVQRNRKRWGLEIKYNHIPKFYPWLFSVLSGLEISKRPNAMAVTESGVVCARHNATQRDATVLIFEETKSSPMSDTAACLISVIIVIDESRQVHMSEISLEYDNGRLASVSMSARVAIDYCENWMSGSFRRRDPYNTIASVCLSLGVYLSDVKQECLKKLTNLQAGNLDPTRKWKVGNITVGDLVAVGMAKWNSSRLYNDIAKCRFVDEIGQLRVVDESTSPRNQYKVVERNVHRVPRGS